MLYLLLTIFFNLHDISEYVFIVLQSGMFPYQHHTGLWFSWKCWGQGFEYTNYWQLCFCRVQFQLNQDKLNFSTLRNIQGLHAPLKLQMEYRAARQVLLFTPLPALVFIHQAWPYVLISLLLSSFQIQRLPFLQSSNLALDTLRGSDESIGFEDILNGQNLILSALSLTAVMSLRVNSNLHPVFVCLSSFRSSPEWNDGRASHDGGIQTGNVVNKKRDTDPHTHTHVVHYLFYWFINNKSPTQALWTCHHLGRTGDKWGCGRGWGHISEDFLIRHIQCCFCMIPTWLYF